MEVEGCRQRPPVTQDCQSYILLIARLDMAEAAENEIKLENVSITVVLPRAASRCARTRSHSYSLALAHPPVGSNYLALDRTRLLSLVHLSARTLSILLELAHTLALTSAR